jgi:DMSO/TMAO reductase YedYZ molybdopterin-dependent catalytic subunit
LKVGVRPVRVWTWSEFQALPQTEQVVDIHCVTTSGRNSTPAGAV